MFEAYSEIDLNAAFAVLGLNIKLFQCYRAQKYAVGVCLTLKEPRKKAHLKMTSMISQDFLNSMTFPCMELFLVIFQVFNDFQSLCSLYFHPGTFTPSIDEEQ